MSEINGLRAIVEGSAGSLHHIQEYDPPYFQEADPFWRVVPAEVPLDDPPPTTS